MALGIDINKYFIISIYTNLCIYGQNNWSPDIHTKRTQIPKANEKNKKRIKIPQTINNNKEKGK